MIEDTQIISNKYILSLEALIHSLPNTSPNTHTYTQLSKIDSRENKNNNNLN